MHQLKQYLRRHCSGCFLSRVCDPSAGRIPGRCIEGLKVGAIYRDSAESLTEILAQDEEEGRVLAKSAIAF